MRTLVLVILLLGVKMFPVGSYRHFDSHPILLPDEMPPSDTEQPNGLPKPEPGLPFQCCPGPCLEVVSHDPCNCRERVPCSGWFIKLLTYWFLLIYWRTDFCLTPTFRFCIFVTIIMKLRQKFVSAYKTFIILSLSGFLCYDLKILNREVKTDHSFNYFFFL